MNRYLLIAQQTRLTTDGKTLAKKLHVATHHCTNYWFCCCTNITVYSKLVLLLLQATSTSPNSSVGGCDEKLFNYISVTKSSEGWQHYQISYRASCTRSHHQVRARISARAEMELGEISSHPMLGANTMCVCIWDQLILPGAAHMRLQPILILIPRQSHPCTSGALFMHVHFCLYTCVNL